MTNNTLKILAVDDEPLNLEILAHTLEKDGYAVECVSDGGRALLLLNIDPKEYDIVLLDRMMPIMDGIEVLESVKENPKLKHIPVILQTAASGMEQIAEGIKAGAYYYLSKPYSSSALLRIVQAAACDIRKKRNNKARKNAKAMVQATKECHFEIASFDEIDLTSLFLANLFPDHDEVLFGIRTLLENAIEHGNLGIGYDLRSKLGTGAARMEEIARRQKLPENTHKRVSINFKRHTNFIELSVEDNGNGFEWQKYMSIDPARAIDDHGRSIALANMRYFDEMTYIGNGNKVIGKIYIEENQYQEESNFSPLHVENSQNNDYDEIILDTAKKETSW